MRFYVSNKEWHNCVEAFFDGVPYPDIHPLQETQKIKKQYDLASAYGRTRYAEPKFYAIYMSGDQTFSAADFESLEMAKAQFYETLTHELSR